MAHNGLRPPRRAMMLPRRLPFTFPHEVVDDPGLNESQKRNILAAWASDACAVESFPTLRRLPGTAFPVTLSSVIDALRQLDRKYARDPQEEKLLETATIAHFARRRSGGGQSPRS